MVDDDCTRAFETGPFPCVGGRLPTSEEYWPLSRRRLLDSVDGLPEIAISNRRQTQVASAIAE